MAFTITNLGVNSSVNDYVSLTGLTIPAGRLVVVATSWDYSDSADLSDSAGNTYTMLVEAAHVGISSVYNGVAIYASFITNALSNGSIDAFASGASVNTIAAAAVQGALSEEVAVRADHIGLTGAPSGASGTPTATDLIFAAVNTAGATLSSPTGGFTTPPFAEVANNFYGGYKIAGTAQSYSGTMATGPWALAYVGFKPVPDVGGFNMPMLGM